MTVPFKNTVVEVMVKFTTDYHEKAHKPLADESLAPMLHGCHPVIGLRRIKMIVMDWAHGHPMNALKTRDNTSSFSVYKDLATAVDLIHNSGLVFGNLRATSILVTDRDNENHMLLLDSDWVNKHDWASYPSFTNERLVYEAKELHPNVRAYRVMLQEYDVRAIKHVIKTYIKTKEFDYFQLSECLDFN